MTADEINIAYEKTSPRQPGQAVPREAYLDIETTGLSYFEAEITVIGIYLTGPESERLVQLVNPDISSQTLLGELEGVQAIYTYNGGRFDLPFIQHELGVDLERHCRAHHDLMYRCWDCNLYGGFKRVEEQLGIPRQLKGVGGYEAVMLWERYRRHRDRTALETLLKYNAEDVINLKVLREKLTGYRPVPRAPR